MNLTFYFTIVLNLVVKNVQVLTFWEMFIDLFEIDVKT